MEAMKQCTKWGASNQRNISHPHSSSAMIPSHCRFLIFETKRQFFQQSAFLSQRKLLLCVTLHKSRCRVNKRGRKPMDFYALIEELSDPDESIVFFRELPGCFVTTPT